MDKERLDELELMLLKFVMEHGTPYTTIHYSAERGLKVYEDEKARKERNAMWKGDDEKPKYKLGDMLQNKTFPAWVCVIVDSHEFTNRFSEHFLKIKYISGADDGIVEYQNLRDLNEHYTLIGNVLDKGAKK